MLRVFTFDSARTHSTRVYHFTFFCGDDIERDLLTDMNLARNLFFQAICLLRVEMERAFSGRSSPDATLGTESVPHKSQVEAV